MRRISGIWLGVALLLSGAVSARADVFDSAVSVISQGFDYIWPDDVDLEDFSLRLGVGMGVAPDYEGSDNYRFRVLPLIDLRYKDIVALQGTRLRLNLLRESIVSAGPLVAYEFGRDEDRNSALEGLGDVDGTFEVGAFIEARNKDFLVHIDFRQALKSGHGRILKIEAGRGLYEEGAFTLALGGQLNWKSRKYAQTYFGVTDTQSTASGLPVFSPDNGFFAAGVNLLSRYKINDHWMLHGITGYSRILGDAADSPLVKMRGSANQFLAGIGVLYHF